MKHGIQVRIVASLTFLSLVYGASGVAHAATVLDTKFIALPIYATEPTEGNTFGILPVFLKVRRDDQSTAAIYAPSVSWNAVINTTATLRWFDYPSETQSFTLIPTVSTNVNYGLLANWKSHPREVGEWSDDDLFRAQRSIFFRFFGIGQDTPESAQSSYTRLWSTVILRHGLNIAPYLNLGATLEARRDIVQNETVPDLPASPDVFAGTPGMGGGAMIGESVDIRFDTRKNEDYSSDGFLARAAAGPYQGLSQCPDYAKFEFESRALFKELSWLEGAGRMYWHHVTSSQVPFYYQSSLGGEYLLRGFIDDRFIDQGAWEAEFEQRILLFQTHIYGVTTDWRVDPFVAVGRVYGSQGGVFQNPAVSSGVGFRAYVHPNVVGRVDFATGGEGWNIYVDIGYPY